MVKESDLARWLKKFGSMLSCFSPALVLFGTVSVWQLPIKQWPSDRLLGV